MKWKTCFSEIFPKARYVDNLEHDSCEYNGDDIFLKAVNTEDSLICRPNGAVELYHNNTKTFETVALGKIMKTNPFDQPAVEKVKILTKKFLVSKKTSKKKF